MIHAHRLTKWVCITPVLVTIFIPGGINNMIWLLSDWKLGCFFFEGVGVGGSSGNLFGVQKSNTACFAWSLFNFMEVNARCACEKDSIVTVMLIFLFTGIDSTKWCEREATKGRVQTQRGTGTHARHLCTIHCMADFDFLMVLHPTIFPVISTL